MKIRITVFLLLTFICKIQTITAQPVIHPEGDYPVQQVVSEYIVFFGGLDNYLSPDTKEPEMPAEVAFKELFTNDAQISIDIPVPGDVVIEGRTEKRGTIVDFEGYYGELDQSVRAKFIKHGIRTSTSYQVLKGMDDNGTWYVWVDKSIPYGVNSIMHTIVKLSIKKLPGTNEYRIFETKEEKTLPADKDGDYIADEYDQCRDEKIKGQEAITARGCKIDRLNRKQPSTTLGFSIAAGILSILNNEIKEADISAQSLVVKPGYFAKSGYIIDISGTYTFSAYSAFRFGFMRTQNAVDEEGMAKTVNEYMAENSTGYNKIKFFKTSRKLTTPYIGLKFGNLYKAKSVVSAEVLAGLAIPSNASSNFNYDITTTDSSTGIENTYSYTSQFSATPFPLLGFRICYETGVTKDGLGRLFLNAQYMAGKYNYNNGSGSISGGFQEGPSNIYLPTGSSILFEGGRVHLWGVSAGFFYNLTVSKVRKEQERYYKLIGRSY